MITRKQTLFGIGLLVWSLSASGADTVRIAYIGMLSGPFALVGEDILKSFRGVADMVNARGGALGNKQIEVVGFDGEPPRQLTVGGGYRSPVFTAGDTALWALKGRSLVSVPLDGGTPREFRVPSRVVKLLGADRQDADRLLLLMEAAEGTSELAELSLKSGRLTPKAIDRRHRNQRRMLSHLGGQNRDYDGVSIRVRTESKAGVGGHIEWSDIYVQRGQEPAINVSRCDGADCGQPALSADRKYVVFIRAMKRP